MRNCTFCDILGNQDNTDETPLHLLFECSAVENLINNFFSWLFEENNVITRQGFLTEFTREENRKND